MYILHQLVRGLQLFGSLKEFVFAHADQPPNLALHQPHVAHCLHHIASARLTLRANHGGSFGYAPQCLAQIFCSANKGHVELGLVDVVDVVGRAQHFALVDVVNLDGLQYLCLSNMSDTALRHHGDAHRLLYATNHLGVTHPADSTCSTDVSRNPFQCHHGTCSRFFSDTCLFGSGHVHNHAALQHLCQLAVQFLSVLFHVFYVQFLFPCLY